MRPEKRAAPRFQERERVKASRLKPYTMASDELSSPLAIRALEFPKYPGVRNPTAIATLSQSTSQSVLRLSSESRSRLASLMSNTTKRIIERPGLYGALEKGHRSGPV